MNLIEGLNPEQKDGVLHTYGALLLLAGAGSGKTRVLTHRIAHMIEQGISPYNILAITFTNKAAKEMKERVNKISTKGELVWVSTFHSTCVRILRYDIDKLGLSSNFTIYDSDDTERIIKRCIKQLNMDDKQYQARPIINVISGWKDELKRADIITKEVSHDFRLSQISKIYTLYEKTLRENNALDFDDIIFKCVELFTICNDVLEKYQERFKFIMVDEYQDTNTSQYQLIKLLSSKHGNLCVVGDDDQSIYGWRGANIRNILDFEKDYKECKTIKLEQNYRSTQSILTCANEVISNNTGRKDKKLWTSSDDGSKVFYYKSTDEYDEARFIVGKISENIKNLMNLKDHAILYRTNAQSRVIEDQLVKKNIPYRLLGGVRFYERREIKDLLAYLKFINNQRDSLALTRIINVPKRGIGDTTISKIGEYADYNEISFFDSLGEAEFIGKLGNRVNKLKLFRETILELAEYSSENTVADLINEIIVKINYIQELENENSEEAIGRIDNINELISKAIEFEKTSETKTLSSFLEDVALVADVDAYSEDEDYVVLMTLHSSKGLEFECVFLAGFEESIFPTYRAITSTDLKDLEEERRLCYVGITRAKKTLFLSSATCRMQHGKTVYNSTSRFLKEFPKNLLEQLAVSVSQGRNTSFKESKSTYNSDVKLVHLGSKGEEYLFSAGLEKPKNVEIDFEVGDSVKQLKYGIGTVLDIRTAGADYEVTVEFQDIGKKKFMAHLSKLKKYSS
jgi:DNA helicase II / ATP-dependent DNA helicase PcrA